MVDVKCIVVFFNVDFFKWLLYIIDFKIFLLVCTATFCVILNVVTGSNISFVANSNFTCVSQLLAHMLIYVISVKIFRNILLIFIEKLRFNCKF